MNARTPRVLTITGTAATIRDNTQPPPTMSLYYYASGGANLFLGKTSGMNTTSTGFPAVAGMMFSDPDTTPERFAKSDGANITLYIQEFDN